MDQPEWDSSSAKRPSVFTGAAAIYYRPAVKVSKNVAASLLAYLPLIPTLAIVLLVVGELKLTYVVIAFGAAVGAVVSVVLAREDARVLLSRGFDEAAIPSPFIASIAPWLYLGLRGNKLFPDDARSLRPFWQHVGLTIVFVLTAMVFPALGGLGRMLLDRH